MKISIDTKEDSHEEIKKVIKMLQNLVGDSQEIFSNEPQAAQETKSSFNNLFWDASSAEQTADAAVQESGTTQEDQQSEEASQSSEDLFGELFSEEEIKKMDTAKIEEQKDEEKIPQSKSKKYDIEFY